MNKHIKTTPRWNNICNRTGRYPNLQDLLNWYNNQSNNCKSGMLEELEQARNVFKDNNASDRVKAEVLLIPDVKTYRIHQWRLKCHPESLEQATSELASFLSQNGTFGIFDDVYHAVERVLKKIPNVSYLTYYDVAKRLWYAVGNDFHKTKHVYLFCGAKNGAQSVLNRKVKAKELISEFPKELRNMDALYLEDFLCVMHKELAIM